MAIRLECAIRQLLFNKISHLSCNILTGTQQLRPLSHHPRHRSTGEEQAFIGQHQPSCASCARVSQQFSLPRRGRTTTGFNKENYLTMPTRTISTRDDYRVEHDVQPPLRRGTSYHHLQG